MSKQELLSLKEENMKFMENFDKFWKKHEANKKIISKNNIRDFMEEQKTLMDNINQRIDKIISKDPHQNTVGALPQKRKRSGNLCLKESSKASGRPRKELKKGKNSLEILIETPGLHHLAENIFLHLNYKDLKACQLVNRSSKSFLDNPRFWIKKFVQRGLSKPNEIDWIKAIQLTMNTDFEKNVLLYLKRSLNLGKTVDLPCFIDEDNLQRIHIVGKNIHKNRRIEKYFKNHEKIELKNMVEINDGLDRLGRNEEVKNFEDYTSCCVQVLAPSKYFYGFYDYYLMMISSKYGYLKIVKSLIPLMYMYKPNAPNPMLSFGVGVNSDLNC